MGNYNSQYESYYSKLAGKKSYNSYNNNYSYRYNQGKNNAGMFQRGWLAKRFMNELIGVLCLILFAFMCKIVVIPETQMLYEYSKNMVNQDFDYSKFMTKVKNTQYADIQLYVENLIGSIRLSDAKIY
jgi:hypothetical protein